MGVLEDLKEQRETVWINPEAMAFDPNFKWNGCGFIYIKAAQNRFMRYLPYVREAFPETAAKMGVIESPLKEIPEMKKALEAQGVAVPGRLYLKDDARMPIAGSVKARGGIHAVMAIAENVCIKEGIMLPADDHAKMNTEEFRQVFGKYTIQVGSTGNLGISIGRMASRMGFKVIVHMSSDAKQWKKDLLRSEGVTVKEYEGDYTAALAEGRKESEADSTSFFIDDENSKDLFFGYATAAMRLRSQFRREKIEIDPEHPLFVYIPCGVGGAPGGIAFGLKQFFGTDVHCFFVEPTAAPCMTLGLGTGEYDKISVQDIGLDGKTIADGLAVGRPSGFAAGMMDVLMSGSMTVSDEHLMKYQKELWNSEQIYLEPSACAGFAGLQAVLQPGEDMEDYLAEHNLQDKMDQAIHIIWGTGGGLVPPECREV